MDIKAKMEEYLDEEDLLYINIYLESGASYYLLKPHDVGTLNLVLQDNYFSISGSMNDANRVDTSIPYERVTHISAAFGTDESIIDAEGNPIDDGAGQ